MPAVRRKLGEILVGMQALTADKLAKALEMQKIGRQPIGTILIRRGFCKKADVLTAVGMQMGLEPIDLDNFIPPHNVATFIDSRTCETNGCMIAEIDETTRPKKTITLAVTHLTDMAMVDTLARKLNAVIRQKAALHHQIEETIKKVYYAQDFGYDLSFHENSGGFRHVKTADKARAGAAAASPAPDPNAMSHPFDDEQALSFRRPRAADTDKEIDALREQVSTLQMHLNTVIRILAKKGQITREEFAAELAKLSGR